MTAPQRDALIAFVKESNRIEGIDRAPSRKELDAHAAFITLQHVRVEDVCSFVKCVANAELRERFGMDVIVGDHRPPPGGEGIRSELDELLWEISDGHVDPFRAHVRYETLHPFMDGNGRSGRALWAWHMRREGRDPFSLPFLHRFYYQTLSGTRP